MSDEKASAVSVEVPTPELHRTYTGTARTIIWVFSAAVALFHMLFIAGVFFHLGFDILIYTFNALSLGLMLTLTFIWIPATSRSPKSRLPWYDAVGILLSLTVSLYLAVNYTHILEEQNPATILQQVLGVIAIILVLEAVRRAIGWVLTILAILFLMYPFLGGYVPGFLYIRPVSLQKVIQVVYLYPEGIYGPILHIMANVIITFLVFGAFLRVSGAGTWFVDLASALLGHVRGGPAKVAVIASAFFGSINGSALANVATTGTITIPMMKGLGYKPYFAGAVESVASNGGQIMPPVMGVAAFIMMDFLDMSYIEVMVAAFVPAILYFLALLLMVDFEAAKTGLKGLPREQLPPLKQTFLAGWFYLLPIVALLFIMLVLRWSAATAGVYATVSVIIVTLIAGWFKKEKLMGPRKFVDGLSEGTQSLPQVGAATAAAGFLTAVMFLTGFGLKVGQAAVMLSGDNFAVLLILGAVGSLILGMGMPTSATYIMTALLVAPALIVMGMPPLAAHFFVFYFGLAAMITPPVCLVAYVGASLAGANFFRTGYEAMRLGIVTYLVPFALAFSPALLMVGSPGGILWAILFAAVGVLCLAAGLIGHLMVKVTWLERILLFAAGIALFGPTIIPVRGTDVPIHIIGIGVAALIMTLQVIRWRLFRSKPAATA